MSSIVSFGSMLNQVLEVSPPSIHYMPAQEGFWIQRPNFIDKTPRQP